tara:strand:- start:1838 stop:2290 length:453 start_codon:yes stop_codon:yes gene_type:complete
MAKKKFSETKIGAFLTKAAPGILNVAGDILPDAGAFGLIKNLIIKDEKMPPEDKEKALLLLKQDITEMEEISKRWMYDLKSDSWLSKNTRPMTLVFLTVSMVILIFSDSIGDSFKVDPGWVDLLKSLLITVYCAYFGSRGYEKGKSMSKK